jgi:hypothetical protein
MTDDNSPHKKTYEKFTPQIKRLGDALVDAAKLGSQEISRGMNEARKQVKKVQLVGRRKDLFAELGRALYEAYEDGLPAHVKKFVDATELKEIIHDISQIDEDLSSL